MLATSPTDSWLPLLCWDSVQAQRLGTIVQGDVFQIHPVSGEVDYGEVAPVEYKRFDEETLRAKLHLPDLGLTVTYLWCSGDQNDGNSWQVSEVKPLEEQENKSTGWSSSIVEACHLAEKTRAGSTQNLASPGTNARYMQGENGKVEGAIHDDEDDDDGEGDKDDDESYWAQYATTPGRSPGCKRSPPQFQRLGERYHQGTTSEAGYYARYAHVQPDMENDDPSKDRNAIGKSPSNGDVMRTLTRQRAFLDPAHQPVQIPKSEEFGKNHEVKCRRLSSPSSRSTAVSRLEDSAVAQSASEVAIRQHVSTSIKSLFRLTRGAGIDQEEFSDLVRRELDTLSLIAEDD
jgi:hypothetical protein